MIDTHNPLLVFALEQESANHFDEYNVLYTGVGKVLAAMSLSQALAEQKPSVVINLGTAGSKSHATGCVVNPTTFVQRDMDVTALGFEAYQTPFTDMPAVLRYGTRLEAVPEAACGTGDSFSVQESFGGGLYDVVDMEAYALASTCRHYDVPFLCLKYISDGADGAATQDWQEALEHTSMALKQHLTDHVLSEV